MMKLVRCSLAVTIASLMSGPALGQGLTSPGADARADTALRPLVFLRIPLGGDPREQGPRLGFALASGCLGASSFRSEASQYACDTRPFRALEVSTGFVDEQWSLAFRNNTQRAEIAAWAPRTGALSLAGEGDPGTWIWVGLGVAAGLGVVAALSQDSDPLLCTGNTIPNPIAGTCEPLVLN